MELKKICQDVALKTVSEKSVCHLTESMPSFLQGEIEKLPSFGKPSCKFVNVVLGKQAGVVLLESPVGSGFISRTQLSEEISTVFGIDPTRKRQIFADASFKEEIGENVAALDGKTVFVRHGDASRATLTCDDGSVCPFVDVEHGGKKATILLENPAGYSVCNFASQVSPAESKWCSKVATNLKSSSSYPVTRPRALAFFNVDLIQRPLPIF